MHTYSYILILFKYKVFITGNKTSKVKKAINSKSQEFRTSNNKKFSFTVQAGYDIVINYMHIFSWTRVSFRTQDTQSAEGVITFRLCSLKFWPLALLTTQQTFLCKL